MRSGLRARLSLRWGVAALIVAVCAFALPSAAVASTTVTGPATFSARTPADGSSVGVVRPPISVKAYDVKGLAGSPYYSMKVDGLAQTATFTRTDANNVTLSFSPRADMANGTHTVYVSVKNNAGVYSTTTWSFTVSRAPLPSAPSPIPGSTVAVTNPVVSVTVGGNTTGLTSVVLLDGAPVPATFNAGTGVLSAPTSGLANDASHDVTVTVTNSSGNSATLAWSFSVQIYADMPTPASGCVACHPGFPDAHPMANCLSCHGPGSPVGEGWNTPDYGPHAASYIAQDANSCVTCHTSGYATVPPLHSMTSGATSHNSAGACSPCHVKSLTTEHYRYGKTCFTCHASTNPLVAAAVATGRTDCEACHPNAASHTTVHETPVAASCAGAGCHTGSGLTEVHAKSTCDTCHKSTDERVIAAIAGSVKTCDACHSTASHEAQHATAVTPTCAGAGCHVGTSLTGIHINADGKYSCATCHKSTDADVIAAIAANDKSCTACHDAAGHGPAHDAAVSAGCAGAGCHAGTNLTTIHTGTCASCHSSNDPRVTTAIAANDKSCTACHGGSDPHPDHTAADSASATCASAGCHNSGDVMTLHANRVEGKCAVCHANPTKGDLTAGKLTTACGGCHSAFGVDYHTNMAVHVTPVSYYESCGHCHHAWGSNPTKGPDVTLHAGGCATCHNATTDLTGKTTNCDSCHTTPGGATPPAGYHPTFATDHAATSAASQDCARCHSTDVRVVHASAPNACATCHETYACGECHEIHMGQAGLTAGVECVRCHTTAGSDYHASFTLKHTYSGMDAACQASGCHTNKLADVHAAYVGAGKKYPQYSDSCALCHLNDNSNRVPANATSACSSCHGATNHAAAHQAAGGADSVSAGMVNGDHDLGYGGWMSCSDCHSTDLLPLHANNCNACHGASAPAAVKSAIANHNKDCTACHPGQHLGENPAHEDVYNNGCDCHDADWNDPLGSCTNCHPASTPVLMPSTTSNAQAAYINDATIQLSATDGVSGSFGIKATYYVLDGSAAATGTQIVVQAPASGTQSHTLKFWSTDWSGNTEASRTVFFNVTADSFPPVTTSNVVSGKTYAGDQAFALSATDANSIVAGTWWQLDGSGSTWTTGTSVVVPAPAAGTATRTLYYYSRDGKGNKEATQSVTFSILAGQDLAYTGANQSFVVPAGVTTMSVTLNGGSGGGNYYGSTWLLGGLGGRVTAVVPVTPGSAITVKVGGRGMDYVYGGDGQVHTLGGWPNGGKGGLGNSSQGGGGGGGSSSILSGSTILAEAGGAGGAGYSVGSAGGAQGTMPGGNQVGGNGNIIGGGGGGGWNAGTAGNWLTNGGRGGLGGTSYIAVGSGTLASGVNNGAGSVTIRYAAGGAPADTTPPSGSMSLSNGAAYSTSTAVSVNSTVTDNVAVTDMSIDPGTGTFGSWVAYAASSAITLPTGDGTKSVRVQYRDAAGNVTTLTDTIVVDATMPTGTMSVNSNAMYATAAAATVNSVVSDAVSGIYQMSIDPGTGAFGSWVAYSASSAITLPAGDGTKTVRIQYRDNAGNILTLTDTIILDAVGPTGTMSVNSNATYANSTAATVNSAMTDTGSSVTQMSIDPGTGTYGPWIAYAASSAITLPTGSGTKTVRVQYRDANLNVTTVTDTIVLDTVAPTGTMSVNNNATYATTTAMTLNSAVSDALSGIYQMQIDPGTGTYGAWIAYSAGSAITLPAGDGTKTVRVQYKDNAGMVLSLVDTIVLDTTAPTGTMSVNNGGVSTASADVTVNSSVSDAISGIFQMSIDPGTGTYGSWVAYSASSAITLPAGSGTKTVRVQYKDNAGLLLTLTDTIVLSAADLVAPTTTSDARATYLGSATINLVASDNVGGTGVAGTAYKLDGGVQTTGTVVTTSAIGSHTLEFWSVDVAGNKEAAKTANFDVSVGQAFNFTGSDQSFVVPAGVTAITADIYGAQGGDTDSDAYGGAGGLVHATFPVTPGQVLTLRVGGDPGNYASEGGWPNGGGSGGGHGAAGGGSTSILSGSTIWAEAGGGGGGDHAGSDGGSGGYAGWLPGGNQSGEYGDGAGGGGGWNGGAGYAEHEGGGDGGSSYLAYGTGTLTEGVNSGHGWATLTWTPAPSDTTPPAGTMSVNGGAAYTGTTAVSIGAAVADAGSGISDMRIDPGTGTYGGWTAYGATIAITLPTGDGLKTVRVEYRDVAGNVLTLTDTITLDTSPPVGLPPIYTPTYTNNPSVTLDTAVTDSGSGTYQMRIDPGSGTFGAWVPYATFATITLPGGDGPKAIRVQYVDNAGNTTSVYSDVIVLDTAGPTGTVTIDNNAFGTNTAAATLNSAMTDSLSGLTQMSVDPGTGTYGPWIAYSASYAFTLPTGDGVKTVRAQYRDAAGNIRNYSDTITMDTVAPTTTSDAVSTYTGNATINFTGHDTPGSGVNSTYYRLDGGAQTAKVSVTVPAPSSGSAVHTVEFWSVDYAGNTETTHQTATFTLNAVSGPVSTFIDGSPYEYNNAMVELNMSGSATAMHCTLDGWDDTFDYNGPFQVYGEGDHTLEYWATDSSGNAESHHVAIVTVAPGDPSDSHDIRIRVVQNGDPVEGVEMVLCATLDPSEDYASWGWGYHVFTDSDGYAVWENMPGRPGGYRVRATDYAPRAYYWEAEPGYTDEVSEREMDLDAESIGTVHVTVHDEAGNPVEGVDVEAVFDNGDIALDPTQTDPAVATTASDGLAQLEIYPTHHALRIRSEQSGVVNYSEEFHVDYYGANVDVDVTYTP